MGMSSNVVSMWSSFGRVTLCLSWSLEAGVEARRREVEARGDAVGAPDDSKSCKSWE